MKDYAKKTSASQASFRKTKQKSRSRSYSRWPLYIGMMCLLTLCVMMALKIVHDIHPSAQFIQTTLPMNAVNTQHAIKKQNTHPTKIKNDSNDSVEYDFYQLLPKMTVEIPNEEASSK